MKKILSCLLIAIMVSAMMAPISVQAGEVSAVIEKGNGKLGSPSEKKVATEKSIKDAKADLEATEKNPLSRAYYPDRILPRETLPKSVYTRGSTAILPFYLYSFGNYGERYLVEIYDSSWRKLPGGAVGNFPYTVGRTNLNIYWDTKNEKRGKYWVACSATKASDLDDYAWPIYLKDNQKISASNITKVYAKSSFSPSIKTSGNGKLSYKSDNTKVVTIDGKGKIAIKGTGVATITVSASATDEYRAATKKIIITIKPAKSTLSKVTSPKKGQMKVTLKKDTKATGYQVVYATNKKFSSGKKSVTLTKNSATSKTISKLKSKKTYYVKTRAYKTVKGKKIYGAYSAVKQVKVK